MPTLKKNRSVVTNAILCLFCVLAVVAVISSYEIISVFVATLFDTVQDIDGQAIQDGIAGY